MKEITSKISGLYIGLVVFIHIFSATVIVISATYLDKDFYIEKRIAASFIIVIMSIFLIWVWFEIMSMKKVVNSEHILIYGFKSVKRICYSEIDSISTKRTRVMMTGNIPLTDGFRYSVIILKQGTELIISPDKFENSAEIMSFIRDKLPNRKIA